MKVLLAIFVAFTTFAAQAGSLKAVSPNTSGVFSVPNATSAGSTFAVPSLARRCNRFATFGDSKTANSYFSTTLGVQSSTGGLVSDGTTVTAVVASAVGMMAGNYVLFANGSDANTHDQSPISALSILNGQLLLITGNPTATTFTVSANTPRGNVPAGDYSTVGGFSWTVLSTASSTDGSIFRRLQAMLPNPPMLTAPYAVSGTESGFAKNMVIQSLLPGAPLYDCAFIDVGTNNIDGAITTSYAAAQAAVETTLADQKSMVDMLLAAGKRVFLLTQPPSSYSGFSATQLQQVNICFYALRHRMYDAFGRSALTHIIDVMRDTSDGTAANGGWITNYSADGVHPATVATLVVAKAEAPNLSMYFNDGNDANPIGILEDSQTYAQAGILYPNLVQNAGMVGTSGTVASGVTGTAPNSWVIVGPGTAVASAQQARQNIPAVIAGSNLWGYGLNINVTWTGAAQTISALSNVAGLVPGNCYRFGFTATALGNATGLGNLEAILAFAGGNSGAAGGALNSFGQENQTALNTGTPLVTGDQLQITNDVTCIPSTATFTSVDLFAQLTSIASGTTNIQVSNPFVRQVPSNVWTTAANDPHFDAPFYLRKLAA